MREQVGRAKVGRSSGVQNRCESCGLRLTIGEPRVSNSWPNRLRLTREQHDLLLTAAVEFEELGGGTAVDYVDWIALDVLRGAA